MGVVISLCDLTGNMVQPWVEAGYQAVLVDPQHLFGVSEDENITRIGATVEEAMSHLSDIMYHHNVSMVFGFPPCNDMAVSGARWFKTKYEKDPLFQAKAVMVAEQCRTVGKLSGAPWMIENPVSVLASAFGKSDYIFDPCDYTTFEPADNYTKKTCLDWWRLQDASTRSGLDAWLTKCERDPEVPTKP